MRELETRAWNFVLIRLLASFFKIQRSKFWSCQFDDVSVQNAVFRGIFKTNNSDLFIPRQSSLNSNLCDSYVKQTCNSPTHRKLSSLTVLFSRPPIAIRYYVMRNRLLTVCAGFLLLLYHPTTSDERARNVKREEKRGKAVNVRRLQKVNRQNKRNRHYIREKSFLNYHSAAAVYRLNRRTRREREVETQSGKLLH